MLIPKNAGCATHLTRSSMAALARVIVISLAACAPLGASVAPSAPVGLPVAPLPPAPLPPVPTGFVVIPAGSYWIGSSGDEISEEMTAAETRRPATIPRAIFMRSTEITQREWLEAMPTNPSTFADCADCPVEGVSWFDSVAYANARSKREGLAECYALADCTGEPGGACPSWGGPTCASTFRCHRVAFAGLSCRGYRLPTEAEWEVAARAGTTTATYGATYAGPIVTVGRDGLPRDGSYLAPDLNPIAWYLGNCDSTHPAAVSFDRRPDLPSGRCATHAVASTRPNRLGLFDMLGNVAEWCHDTYSYPHEAPTWVPTRQNLVVKGGAWDDPPGQLRAASRIPSSPDERWRNRGFRIVRAASMP